jgi:hypothetical protein
LEELQNNIERYLDGKGTSYYAPVIKSIRDLLHSIDELNKSEGGAIIFFEQLTMDGDLMMQVFPFKKNTCIFKDGGVNISLEAKEKLFSRINEPKPYNQFWHYNQFKTHNNSDEHCSTRVPKNNIVSYDKEGIIIKAEDPSSGEFADKKLSWTEFCEDVHHARIDKNTYEQILLESDCKGVSFVPIPVLSTPSILLVLNNKHLDNNKIGLFKSLYFRSRDTVDTYVYSRLLDSLGAQLKQNGEVWEEDELMDAFIQEICKIMLPVSYQINDGPVINYYPYWPTKGFESTYVIPLLDGRCRVTFNLTSFHYVDLDNPGVDCTDWKWIHLSDIYKSNAEQSILLICKLFDMIHSNWELLQAVEKRATKKAYDKILQTLGGLDIKGLLDTVANIHGKIQEVYEQKEKLDDIGPVNQLTAENDRISLVIDGEHLISPGDIGDNVGQKSGFIYLQYVLQQATRNSNNFKTSPESLFESVRVPKKVKVDPNIAARKAEAQEILDENIKGLITAIANFYSKNKFNIDLCREKGGVSQIPKFNDGFYFTAKLLMEYNKNRLFKYVDQQFTNFDIYKELQELIKIYQKSDQAHFSEMLAVTDVSVYFDGIKKAKPILAKDNTGGNISGHVRECFRAAIKKLRKRKSSLSGSALKAMEHFLANLEESGLINLAKDEPKSQVSYHYNQNNKKAFINWQFEGKEV